MGAYEFSSLLRRYSLNYDQTNRLHFICTSNCCLFVCVCVFFCLVFRKWSITNDEGVRVCVWLEYRLIYRFHHYFI